MTESRRLGALLGAAIGDALGAPLEKLSHQNVRLYYRGVRTFHADEKRGDLAAGQGTGRTTRMLALAAGEPLDGLDLPRALPGPEAPVSAAPAIAAPLGLRWAEAGWTIEAAAEAIREALAPVHSHPAALAAATVQAFGVRALLTRDAATLDGAAFFDAMIEATTSAEAHFGADARCSARLRTLAPHLAEFPLDLQDRCEGTIEAVEAAWPFAVAMFARGPELAEASLLAAVNVGGDAPSVGACLGALLGALNGAEAFPEAWRDGLVHREAVERLA